MATQQQHSSGSPDAISDESESNGIDRGEVFDLLSNQRRRYAIHYCKGQDDPVELGELAEHVAAWELDKEVAKLTSAEHKRVYTSLQQTHLPTLDRADMVEFDDRTIELTENISELDIYLDVVPSHSIPWSTYYLGLTAVASIVVTLFAVSVAHVVQNRQMRLGEMERSP